MIYATGPSYSDHYSAGAVVLMHFFVFFGGFRMIAILRSKWFHGILARLRSEDARRECTRLFEMSKYVARGVMALSAVAATLIYCSLLPVSTTPPR